MNTPTQTYLAVAYRWGWTNNHQYFVLCSTDLGQVRDAAYETCDDRGGKYGVAVYKMPTTPGGTPELLEYASSTYGEKAPHENPRLNIFRRLGQTAFFAVKDGKALLPPTDGGTSMDWLPVDVPAWLRSEAARMEDDEMGMVEIRERLAQQRATAKENAS